MRALADDDELANESIEYTIVDAPPDDPEATLVVGDQEGDGESVVVEEASADVRFAIVVIDEDGEQRARASRSTPARRSRTRASGSTRHSRTTRRSR